MSLLDKAIVVRLGIRIDRAPAVWWLVLLLAALVPTWWWTGRLLRGDVLAALVVVPLVALAALLWQRRACLRAAPRLGWLALALLAALLATATLGLAPAPASAMLGALSLAGGLAAFLPMPDIKLGEAFANRFLHRVAYKLLCAVLLPVCGLWGAAQIVRWWW